MPEFTAVEICGVEAMMKRRSYRWDFMNARPMWTVTVY